MSNEEKQDKKALLYLQQNGITEIEQVTPRHRAVLYSILDKVEEGVPHV